MKRKEEWWYSLREYLYHGYSLKPYSGWKAGHAVICLRPKHNSTSDVRLEWRLRAEDRKRNLYLPKCSIEDVWNEFGQPGLFQYIDVTLACLGVNAHERERHH